VYVCMCVCIYMINIEYMNMTCLLCTPVSYSMFRMGSRPSRDGLADPVPRLSAVMGASGSGKTSSPHPDKSKINTLNSMGLSKNRKLIVSS
jgi:hypothetical protein